jgi:hypothetical protein
LNDCISRNNLTRRRTKAPMTLLRALFVLVPLLPLFGLAFAGCRAKPAFSAGREQTPAACAAEHAELVAFVDHLPARALGAELRSDLPLSTLGMAPGAGPVLSLTETSLSFDGEPLPPEAWAERARSVPATGSLYVAAAPDVTIRRLRTAVSPLPGSLDLKLLVRTAGIAGAAPASTDTPEPAHAIAAQLLNERDADAQKRLAQRAYAEFSNCSELISATAAVSGTNARERWPGVKQAFATNLPRCRCEAIDAPALRAVLSAEQRAGTATLGAVPLSFVRDERCDASMGLRSVKRLLEQIEKFDADNAGNYGDDAVRFEQIVTNDRLREQFCDALPGETFAALGKARASLYLRVAGSDACEAWRFEPLAPGAPMGTWRRVPAGGEPALAFHYWLAAEEVSVFGPLDTTTASKPTDERSWSCRENYKLIGIDGDSLTIEGGRWFFNEASCRAAAPVAALPGCVGVIASGAPPTPPALTTPAAAPP